MEVLACCKIFSEMLNIKEIEICKALARCIKNIENKQTTKS